MNSLIILRTKVTTILNCQVHYKTVFSGKTLIETIAGGGVGVTYSGRIVILKVHKYAVVTI
jgi:hypothetical protein